MERVLTINKFLKIKTNTAFSSQTLTWVIDQTYNSPCNCFLLKSFRHRSRLERNIPSCHSLLGYLGYFRVSEGLNWVMSIELSSCEKQKSSQQLRWRLRSLKCKDLRRFPHLEPLCSGQCKLLMQPLVCLLPTDWEGWWGKVEIMNLWSLLSCWSYTDLQQIRIFQFLHSPSTDISHLHRPNAKIMHWLLFLPLTSWLRKL